MLQSIESFISTQDEEKNQEIQVTSSESVSVQEQLSIEGHLPFEEETPHKRKTNSIPEQSIEKGFLAEQMSLERGSPTSFQPEVIIIFTYG